MLWQKKKKRKKATKSKAVTQTAPHQLAEELPQTTEPEEKEETPKQKKPAGKKCKKVLSPEKAFLDAFGRLTNRYRAWDVWRDFITMFACSLSNPLDKEHREKRYIWKSSKSTISRIKSCFLNWLLRRSWLWRKIRSKIFWAAFLCLSISATSIMDRSLRRIMSVS